MATYIDPPLLTDRERFEPVRQWFALFLFDHRNDLTNHNRRKGTYKQIVSKQ